ncbi:MAG TPA: SHOCT domain-containing protein [Anaerolineales bacterium]|jgi:hypothetical protein|nr:SHOCT domain-containing protein [Anaerolineales bacterium]
MKLNTSTLVWTFIWCIFMGVTGISIGFGALFPSLNLISKPFVCPNGKMDVDQHVYNPYPGTTITTTTWYCTDSQTGEKRELSTLPMSLIAGVFYGVLLFVVVVIGMVILAKRGDNPVTGRFKTREEEQGDFANLANKIRASPDAMQRMAELKKLRTANLISEAEYESKRNEILKEL